MLREVFLVVTEEKIENYEIWSNNLTKVYEKKENAVMAVNKINLRVLPGIHGFLGPNGAGKTTTINMLIGALSITEGEARIRGLKPGSVAANQLIGFLPQNPQFYKDMTGEEYLIYMGMLGGLSKEEANRRGQELLRSFDMWEERTRQIGKYSGGMKQKIGITAALIHRPKILILDEPTANLDPIGRQNIIDRIKELSSQVSVFISSHILGEIEQMCQVVTMINNGEIVVSDTIKNIKSQFVGNTFLLKTSKDKEILPQLQKDPDIEKAWLTEEEGGEISICIIPKDPEKLQKKIPKLILDNDAILKTFKQPEVTLQDVFMATMAREEKGRGERKHA